MLGRDVKHVVGPARDIGEAGQIERLSIDFSIDGKRAQFAEGAGVDYRNGQSGLFQVLSGAGDVIVIGHHVNHARGRRRAAHGQGCRIAGGAAHGITDHYPEFGAVVGCRYRRRGVAGRPSRLKLPPGSSPTGRSREWCPLLSRKRWRSGPALFSVVRGLLRDCGSGVAGRRRRRRCNAPAATRQGQNPTQGQAHCNRSGQTHGWSYSPQEVADQQGALKFLGQAGRSMSFLRHKTQGRG